MRSSGSTPSPPEAAIRLSVVLVGDDHPRACTGRRLIRQHLAREASAAAARAGRAIVLDPYAPVPLTRADQARALHGGILAVDCSWNRLSADRSRGPDVRPIRGPAGARRLPMLLAANPQHFGRLGELNTAEALAAALFLVGRLAQAHALLAGFAGGRAFFEVNRERLEHYAAASSPEELLREERAAFARS